ncbi:MAG: InlB B-repeat-containing protein [Eubacteriales bacterium]|nr:InlB B-repeat-containing protein [Eubacteriales bacterium]
MQYNTKRRVNIVILLTMVICLIANLSINTLAISPQKEFYQTSTYLAYDSSAYSAIYTALNNSTSQINISSFSLSEDEAINLYYQIIYENPNLFYVDESFKYTYNQHGIVQVIEPSYTITGSALQTAKQTYTTELAKIVNGVNASWSDIEKVMYINDFFALNFHYDDTLTYGDAYSLFTLRTGVCQAYTLAFTAVMNELGIPVTYVISEAMKHTWNLVNVGDQWYHIDVTWNDPTLDMPGRVGHENFLLSDTAIQATGHYDWESNISCTSTKYDNYFWKDVNTPFVYNNGNWYYIKNTDKYLYSYVFDTNTSIDVLKINVKWPNLSKPGSYWLGCFSSLGSYNNILYYNTPTEVYAYNPTTKTSQSVFKLSSTTNNIYYFFLDENELTYYLYTSPNSSSANTGTIDVNDLTTKYEVIYKVDGSVYKTQSYRAGDTITPPADPIKEGYDFKGWSPEIPSKMPANSITLNAAFIVAPCQHIAGKWIITKQPTCSETGTKQQKCTICGEVLAKETIPATDNHNYGLWVTVKQPTYTDTGLKQKTCIVCGDVITETISKLIWSEESVPHTSKPNDTSNEPTVSEATSTISESESNATSQPESQNQSVTESPSESSINEQESQFNQDTESDIIASIDSSLLTSSDNDLGSFDYRYIILPVLTAGIVIALVAFILYKVRRITL